MTHHNKTNTTNTTRSTHATRRVNDLPKMSASPDSWRAQKPTKHKLVVRHYDTTGRHRLAPLRPVRGSCRYITTTINSRFVAHDTGTLPETACCLCSTDQQAHNNYHTTINTTVLGNTIAPEGEREGEKNYAHLLRSSGLSTLSSKRHPFSCSSPPNTTWWPQHAVKITNNKKKYHA